MSKWISVEDRLPKSDVYVLISNEDADIEVGSYDLNHQGCWRVGNDCVSWDFDFNKNYDVTHWMSLPEPPK